jgi:phospholipid/cholesterol/gamma-HCH transport system substrate-binding protein
LKISREVKVGIVFIATIALLVWGYNYLKGSDILKKQYKVYAVYSKVDGLLTANPVTISGMKVGQVTDIYFLDYSKPSILVEMILQEDIPIPENSIAKIYSSDLMGSRAISINFGDSPDFIEYGDTLQSKVEAGLAEEVNKQVQPIKKKAESLLGSIDSIMITIQEVFNENTKNEILASWTNIASTVENLRNTTSNLDEMVSVNKNSLGSIVMNLDSISMTLNSNRSRIDNIVGNLSDFSDTLAEVNLASTLKTTDIALQEFAALLSRVEQGEGTIGQLMVNDSLYDNLNQASKELELLLEDMKLHPKRYVHFSVFGRSDKNNEYVESDN